MNVYQKEGFKDCGDATEHSIYMEKTLEKRYENGGDY